MRLLNLTMKTTKILHHRIVLRIFLRMVLVTLFGMALIISGEVGAAGIDFQREVLPILSEHCTHCHGVDEGKRESGLRLDVRELALRGGDSGTGAIVPGKPEMSELIRRITSDDPDVM